MSRRGGLLLLLLVAVAAAGCGAGADHAQRVALADLNLTAPTPSSSPSLQPVNCRNPTASLRPPATLPAPGAMPAGSAMAAIARRGYLIAGVDQNTLLFAYFNPLDGQIEGFEIDLLRELAQAILGNPNAIRFKAVTTSERLAAVRSGSVDVVADATTITCERKQLVAFSTVYYNASQRILVPIDSGARSVADLSGQRVCVTAGSTSLQTLTRLYPHAVPYPVAQRTDCLVALQQGVVAAVTSDDAILLGFAAQDPRTKLVGPPFASEPYGMVISQAHPELVRFVNGVLARMRADGRWRAEYIHWLARSSSTIPAPPAPQYEG